MPSRRVVTSRKADFDLQQIFEYTHYRWGDAQRFQYSSTINRSLRHLQEFPLVGRDRSELRPGIRSHPAGEHVIFYLVQEDHIYIVRILPQVADVASMFAELEEV
jgi:toxin ParE1/3/4